jgi:hypothetical protein
MDVGTPFIPHAQPTELVEYGQALLDNPAIAPEPLARLKALARDAGANVTLAQSSAIATGGVAQVGMQLAGPPPRSAGAPPDRWNRIHQRQERGDLVQVGRAERDDQGMAAAVDDQVVFAAGFSAVRRVRARERPLLKARTVAASIAARVQSIAPWIPSSFNSC